MGDIKDVRDGTHDSPKYHNEGFPLVTSKNLTGNGLDMTDVSLISEKDFQSINKRSKVDVGDIIFGMIGTIGNPVIVDREGFAIKNIALIKHGGEVTNNFLIQLLKSSIFKQYIQNENAGNTQKFLGLNKIRDYQFLSPSYQEQILIGNFLKRLDFTLALLQKKLDQYQALKKAFLQLMFPQNGESVPQVRFAHFDFRWEQRKLGEVVDDISGNDGRTDLPVLTISAGKGWMNQKDRFSQVIAGTELKNYTLLKKGELSYNHGNSKLAKYGAVFELKEYEEALVPRVYHSFKSNNKSNSSFLEYLFSSKIPDRELSKLITSGARMDGLLNINKQAFFGIKIFVPNIEEQIKIGNFIRKLDNTIALHQNKLDQSKKLKSFLLQKMFV